MLGDAAGTVGIIIGSIVIHYKGYLIIDPIISIAISALILFAEIWAPLAPEAVAENDEDELSPASGSDEPKPLTCDAGDGGEVSDWIASSASEAAPMAGSMRKLPTGATAPWGLGQQVPCHSKKPNKMMAFALRKRFTQAAIRAVDGRFFHRARSYIASRRSAC